MTPTNIRAGIAQRMRQALEQAGISQSEVARRLGRTQSAVNRWLTGSRRPSEEDIEAFAAQTGTTAYYLWHGVPDRNAFAEAFADWVLRFAKLVSEGTAPSEALGMVSGRPDLITEGQRAHLDRAANAMRAFLAEQGFDRWEELPLEEQRRVLELLMAAMAEWQTVRD